MRYFGGSVALLIVFGACTHLSKISDYFVSKSYTNIFFWYGPSGMNCIGCRPVSWTGLIGFGSGHLSFKTFNQFWVRVIWVR